MRKCPDILLALLAVLSLMACANMGTPDGGPYDETPPSIVGTHPRFGATKAGTRKITLRFNENIKLESASEKVVVSPPQLNQPEIYTSGKQITIELMDSLKPDMTYTIDFADAIEDNNEGNPMGDYAFTFSTGERLDTFQLSGYVLNAEDLEPIKGILVGLYAADSLSDGIPDSTFRTQPLQRISRTDSRGHFVVKGLNPAFRYRVFALKDMDQDFAFSQKSEQIAFNDALYSLRSAPDVRYDTIWHDSIYYDSIVPVPYTHFYPDDIVLRAFTEEGQARAFLKSERPTLEQFTLFFTAPDSIEPVVRGLDFDDTAAFVREKTAGNDTLTYWIRDSLLYNRDSLQVTVDYRATDTVGQLQWQTDTLLLISRQTYARRQKQLAEKWENYAKEYREKYRQDLKAKEYAERKAQKEDGERQADDEPEEGGGEPAAAPPVEADADTLATPVPQPLPEAGVEAEDGKGTDKASRKDKKEKKRKKKVRDEDIEVPPMPEEFLEMRVAGSTLDPDQNVSLRFTTPIDTVYPELVHFVEMVNDTERVERPFLVQRMEGKLMEYRLYAEWQPDTKYECTLDTGAFVNIYGQRTSESKQRISVRSLDDYSTLFVSLQQADPSAVLHLLDSGGKVAKRRKAADGKADFYFVKPGTYYLYMFYDRDGDGRWTTGDFSASRQGEEAFFYPGALELRAGWEVTQTWNPLMRPIHQQKPGKITKQKPDKEKDIHSKNQQREQEKKGNKRNGSNGGNSNRSNTYGGGYVNQNQ